MSIQVSAFKDVLLRALKELEKRAGEKSIHVTQLYNYIATADSIQMSYIIKRLVCAGFSVDDILWLVETTGIAPNNVEWVRVRSSIVRAVITSKGEEEC